MAIQTTKKQKNDIEKEIKKGSWKNEKIWNYLIAYLLNGTKGKKYLKKFLNNSIEIKTPKNIWFEAQPISPRKGKSGKTEGNTRLDLAFGDIELRGKVGGSGIRYNNSGKNNTWVCFIEAKLFSDCGISVSFDPMRNQITRVIENLLCFRNNNESPKEESPKNLFFTLLTPKDFYENPNTRLYGYKMQEYYPKNNNAIMKDINTLELVWRNKNINEEFLLEKLNSLEINWITYEDILIEEFGLPAEFSLVKTILEWGENPIQEIKDKFNEIADNITKEIANN